MDLELPKLFLVYINVPEKIKVVSKMQRPISPKIGCLPPAVCRGLCFAATTLFVQSVCLPLELIIFRSERESRICPTAHSYSGHWLSDHFWGEADSL